MERRRIRSTLRPRLENFSRYSDRVSPPSAGSADGLRGADIDLVLWAGQLESCFRM